MQYKLVDLKLVSALHATHVNVFYLLGRSGGCFFSLPVSQWSKRPQVYSQGRLLQTHSGSFLCAQMFPLTATQRLIFQTQNNQPTNFPILYSNWPAEPVRSASACVLKDTKSFIPTAGRAVLGWQRRGQISPLIAVDSILNTINQSSFSPFPDLIVGDNYCLGPNLNKQLTDVCGQIGWVGSLQIPAPLCC